MPEHGSRRPFPPVPHRLPAAPAERFGFRVLPSAARETCRRLASARRSAERDPREGSATRPRRNGSSLQRAGGGGGESQRRLTVGAGGAELHHQLLQMRPHAATERRTPSAPLALSPAVLKAAVYAALPPRPAARTRGAPGRPASRSDRPPPRPRRPARARRTPTAAPPSPLLQTTALPSTSASCPAARTSSRAPPRFSSGRSVGVRRRPRPATAAG